MYIIDNYSHEYKTRRILDLDKILLQEPVHISSMLCAVTQKHTHSSSCVYVPAVTQITKGLYMLGILCILPIKHSVWWTKTLSSMVAVLAASHHSCFLLLVVVPAISSLLWLFPLSFERPFPHMHSVEVYQLLYTQI